MIYYFDYFLKIMTFTTLLFTLHCLLTITITPKFACLLIAGQSQKLRTVL